MTLRWKWRLVHAGLVLLTLWPLAQIGLALRYDLSPWKLFGFGMYAAPRFGMLGMEIYGRRQADGSEEQLVAPTPELQALAGRYLESYRWLGRLASAEELAQAALAFRSDWDQVRIVVFRPRLDPSTGLVVMTHSEETR